MNFRRRSGNFQFKEDPFKENFQSISKIYREVLLLMKISQTKRQVKDMNIKYYDLYYTVMKNRAEIEVVKDKHENIESDYLNYKEFITPIHYIGRKNDNIMLT